MKRPKINEKEVGVVLLKMKILNANIVICDRKAFIGSTTVSRQTLEIKNNFYEGSTIVIYESR